MKLRTTCAVLALALVVSACARGQNPDGLFGPGADPTLGADPGGFAPPAVAGGTLPGTAISDRVLFAVDQSTLSAEAIGTLNAQVSWLTQHPNLPIQIEGHADERGTREYNLALGLRRASAVRDYMVSQGIPDARISVNTFGRERPVATCAADSCWSQNRRAVTVVTGGPGV